MGQVIQMADYFTPDAEQFVGTAAAHRIGLMVGNIDGMVRLILDIAEKYNALGIISSRTGTVAQAIAIDDAVKACNAKLLRFEMAIDAGRQCGQGCLFILGAETISDARKVVEESLHNIDYWSQCIYINEVGHMESHVTPRAGEVLHEIFGTPVGRAFGVVGAAPAGVGIAAVDRAVKAAPVDIVWYGSPSHNLRMMNEFVAGVTGDIAAVQKAMDVGKETGCQLLTALGITPISIQDVAEECGEDYLKRNMSPAVCQEEKAASIRINKKCDEER